MPGEYAIQYSSYEVTWSTSSAQLFISTTVVNPGASQCYSVTGLTGGTTYFFRVWTSSVTAMKYWSDVSNGAAAWAQMLSVYSASLISTDTVRVYYSAAIDNSAEITGNYALNPSLGISSAAIRDGNTAVELKLNPGIINNKEYTITVAGVNGLTGNAAARFVGVYPAPEFIDDFNRPANSILTADTPAGKWDSVNLSTGNSIYLTGAISKKGGYSFYSDDNSTDGNSYVTKSLAARTTYFCRYYFYLPGGFFNGLVDNGSGVFLFRLHGTGGYGLCLQAGSNLRPH